MSEQDLSHSIASVSAWIDNAPVNRQRDSEAATWGRLAKVAEESGEVIAAYIGATGQNPRKGVTNDEHAVARELMDVAVTALAAWEHMTGHRGVCIDALASHVQGLTIRAGLDIQIVHSYGGTS